MRSGRLYPVAVILMMGAFLGVVSLGWGDLIATGSGAKRTLESNPSPAVGGEGKQTPLLMRVLNSPQPVKGSDGKYHLVYELVLTNSSPGAATVECVKTVDPKSGGSWAPLAVPT